MDKIPFRASRYPDEDFKTYQLRRWNETRIFKLLARGRLIWDSVADGTYTKERAEEKARNTFKLDITG